MTQPFCAGDCKRFRFAQVQRIFAKAKCALIFGSAKKRVNDGSKPKREEGSSSPLLFLVLDPSLTRAIRLRIAKGNFAPAKLLDFALANVLTISRLRGEGLGQVLLSFYYAGLNQTMQKSAFSGGFFCFISRFNRLSPVDCNFRRGYKFRFQLLPEALRRSR